MAALPDLLLVCWRLTGRCTHNAQSLRQAFCKPLLFYHLVLRRGLEDENLSSLDVLVDDEALFVSIAPLVRKISSITISDDGFTSADPDLIRLAESFSNLKHVATLSWFGPRILTHLPPKPLVLNHLRLAIKDALLQNFPGP